MITATLLFLLALLPAPVEGGGKVFLSQREALELAFPKCAVVKTTHYLGQKELEKAAKAAGVKIPSGVVRAYVAKDKDGKLVGTAYFDRHKVRTLPQVLMVVVSPDRKVKRIEVLSFSEPLDYLPKAKWFGQFTGKSLGPALALKKQLRNPAGATLTARATTDAVRRVLALHLAINGPTPQAKE